MRSLIGVLVVAAAAMAFVSCGDGGGGGERTPLPTSTPEASSTPPSTIVTSDDGKLTLEVPRGAMDEGTAITIESVPFDALPEELRQLSGARDGYQLEPDGLVFDLPVTATLRLEREELADEPANAISAYALVSYNSADGRDILPGQSTTASPGGGEVLITGELLHFSYLGLTRSSLGIELDLVPREQPVGGTFTSAARARNLNPDIVRVEEPRGVFEASGRVSVAPGSEPFIGEEQVDELNGDGWERSATFQCANEPGPGAYAVAMRATSVVEQEGGEPIRTELQVRLEFDVECIEAGGPTPAGTAGAEAVIVRSEGECEHTQPGVESEVRDRVRVSTADGEPVEGATVDGVADGPGVLQASATAQTDAGGEATLVFPINRVGPYAMVVQRVTLPDGRLAAFDPSSEVSITFEVGEAC